MARRLAVDAQHRSESTKLSAELAHSKSETQTPLLCGIVCNKGTSTTTGLLLLLEICTKICVASSVSRYVV